ncbi:MAG: 50S ribosomal protein L9 [Paracoccaceae bacterium]|nr:50S ribosomal protein L9 [Paracoccaceae bacterium]
MELVLLQRIEKLGQMGDVVHVKDGYARNYLLPQGKALRATKANLARFETERAQLEARNLELRKEAEAVSEKLDDQSFMIIRSASDAGSLYGSVTARDIAEIATEGGFTVARGQIALDRPVKELGLHTVRVILHPEVAATVTVNVARSEEEARLQASGRSIQDVRSEEEAEADFEIAELFDDMGAAAATELEGVEGEPGDVEGESTLVEEETPKSE